MVKYRTDTFAGIRPIEKVEVDSESSKFVFIGDRRFQKLTKWQSYFDTWEEAHNHCVQIVLDRIDKAMLTVKQHQAQLEIVNSFKEE